MTDGKNDARLQLDEIFRLVGAGDLAAAEQLCREALLRDDKDINVLGIFGAILLKKNELIEAEKILLSVTELEPAFAKPHEDLGLLYLNQDKPESAVSCFEKAVALDATQASAFRGLATALEKSGRMEEAQVAQDTYLQFSPLDQSLLLARLAHADGDSQRAESICEDILKRNPENTDALRMLAIIASAEERHVFAEGLLRRIVKLIPENIDAIRELGQFLADRSRFPEAIEMLEQAEEIDATSPQVKLMLGDFYSIVSRTFDALVSYEKCLELSPEEPLALLGRGHILRIMGDREQAESSYRQCIAFRPEIGDAWWSMSSLHGYRASDDEIAQMHANVDAGSLNAESEVAFRFALARACEQRDDYESAWQQYETANKVKRRLVSYDPVEVEVRHSKMTKVFTAEFFQALSAPAATGKAPIFILGMPRSGGQEPDGSDAIP